MKQLEQLLRPWTSLFLPSSGRFHLTLRFTTLRTPSLVLLYPISSSPLTTAVAFITRIKQQAIPLWVDVFLPGLFFFLLLLLLLIKVLVVTPLRLCSFPSFSLTIEYISFALLSKSFTPLELGFMMKKGWRPGVQWEWDRKGWGRIDNLSRLKSSLPNK